MINVFAEALKWDISPAESHNMDRGIILFIIPLAFILAVSLGFIVAYFLRKASIKSSNTKNISPAKTII
jgi:flagellar basal body-associated protein FliL